MAQRQRISIDRLGNEIMDALNETKKIAEDAVIEAVDKTAKDTVKNTKAAAPGRGKYKKSWTSKVTKTAGRGRYGRTVYSRTPGLPHLLENGHEIGGFLAGKGRIRTREFHHVQTDEETAELFEKHFTEVMEKS